MAGFLPGAFARRPGSLRDAYHRTADAWSSIELVHYGPIAEDFRGERLSFWPERKNAVEKALKAALAKADDASLAPDTFRKGSAGVQGLPALERLLFSEGASEADFAGSPEAEFRCRLGSAIATNILAIAREVQAGWVDGDNAIAQRLAAPEIAGRPKGGAGHRSARRLCADQGQEARSRHGQGPRRHAAEDGRGLAQRAFAARHPAQSARPPAPS